MGKCGKYSYLYTKILKIKRVFSFWGNIDAKVDNKGRVAIPIQFRKILQTEGSNIVMLKKDIFQPCLSLFPMEVWNENVTELRTRLNTKWNEKHQQIFRQYVMDVEQIEMDASGRILIPKRYLQMLEKTTDVRFLGVDKYIEIWPRIGLEKPLIAPEDFSKEIQELMSNEIKN